MKSVEHGSDRSALLDSTDTPSSPWLRPDVLGGAAENHRRATVEAALFGASEARAVVVDRFRLLEHLGAGGMGTVYAAYDDQLDRKIAIKLIRPSRAHSAELRERTLREARALARLSHPNVVHVYEVGEVEDEWFVAMEFLAGPTLQAWIGEDPRRPWAEVVEVFRQAGEGLAAAHESGIVHRDFKPQNVMFGGDGRARVLDFGLARVGEGGGLSASTGDDSRGSVSELLTAKGALLGTPAYMAPEQLAGRPADARSDQFSFCVALYEALYGPRPFAGKTVGELAQAIGEGAFTELPSGAAVPARVRKVVVRGLSAAPEERFSSMRALLEVLTEDRSARRRKWWTAAGLAVAVGGGAWLAAATEAEVPDPEPACSGMERELDGIWDDARRSEVRGALESTGVSYASRTAELVEAALDDYTRGWVDARVDACEANLRNEQSDALLDLRMTCLDRRRVAVRATVELLREADASMVEEAGAALTKLPLLARCSDPEALQAEVPPPEEPALAERVRALDGQLVEAQARGWAGHREAERTQSAAVVEAAESLGYAPLTARALLARGHALSASEEYEGARTDFEGAYRLGLGAGMLVEAAEAAVALIRVHQNGLAQHERARAWVLHAEALAEGADDDLSRARFLLVLADLDKAEGNTAEARANYGRALALQEATLGPDHPLISTTHNNLGSLAHMEGEYAEARTHFEAALATQERTLGGEHPAVALSLTNLGTIATNQGKYVEARGHHERALAIYRAALGPENDAVSLVLGNLSNVAYYEGKFEESMDYSEQAFAMRERALGPEHPKVALALVNLGIGAFEAGQNDKAIERFERALAIQEKVLGPDHRDVGLTLLNLGLIQTAIGELDAATVSLTRSRAVYVALNPEHPDLGLIDSGLGDVAAQKGDYEAARELHRSALTLQEKRFGPEHPEVRISALQLGLLLVEMGASREALGPLEQSLAIQASSPGQPAELGKLHFGLAQALWDAPMGDGRDRARARTLAKQARVDRVEGGAEADSEAVEAIDAWLDEHAG